MNLSRNDCKNCGPETLHKNSKCVHCGREFKAEAFQPKDWKRITQKHLVTVKR